MSTSCTTFLTASIVELYSCTGGKGCIMGKCEKCKNHNLAVGDFVNENLSSNRSDSESENLDVNFLWWSKNDGADKVEVTFDVEDAVINMARSWSKNKVTHFYKARIKWP